MALLKAAKNDTGYIRRFPVEMMHDHVWFDRLDYESTEVQYQLFLDQCMKNNYTSYVSNSLSDQDDSLTFQRVHIPQKLHRFINLKAIEQSTGARVILPPPSLAKDEIVVAGVLENVKEAATMVQDVHQGNFQQDDPEKQPDQKLTFPSCMMNDESVWLNRLQYDEAERDAQLQLTVKLREVKGVLENGRKVDRDESSLDESSRSSDLVSGDEDSSDDEFEESTLSPLSFSSELKREEALAKQQLEQEQCKIASYLPSPETIQNGDINVLKDALISLTQAVSTLSVQNNKLNNENNRLKSRLKNTEEVVEKISKGGKNSASSTQATTSDLDQAISKLEKAQKKSSAQFDDAMNSLRDHLHKKDTEYNGKIDKLRTELDKLVTNRTRGIEDAIKEIKKQQQISKQGPQTVKTTRSPTPTKTSVQESPKSSSKSSTSKNTDNASAQASENLLKSVDVAENRISSSCIDTSSEGGGSVSSQTWADRSPIPAANNQPKYPVTATVQKDVKKTNDEDDIWSELEELLLGCMDRCIFVCQLPALYKKRWKKDFPLPVNNIHKFITDTPNNVTVVGQATNALAMYIDPDDIPPHILVVCLMFNLYECKSFRATLRELADKLSNHGFKVATSRISHEATEASNLFQKTLSSSEHGIELTIRGKTLMLRPLIAKLVQKERGGVLLNSFCNILSFELSCHQFTLKVWGYSSMQDLIAMCGPKFFMFSGTGNTKKIILGPLGQLYWKLYDLVRKESGSFLVQTLGAAYRGRFGEDLTFTGSGVSGLEEFVSMFSTEFMLCGEKEYKAIILIPFLLERIASNKGSIGENVVAVDCKTIAVTGGLTNVCGRCIVVDKNLKVLYDSYLKPDRKVTDYRTQLTGIQEHHLRSGQPFASARKEIMALLKNKVVVGRGVTRALESLNYGHPRQLKRDLLECPMLKKEKLSGSSSSADYVMASMMYYKRVSVQWEKTGDFG